MPVRIPLGTFTCVTGVSGLREVHARQRHPLPGPGAGLPPRAGRGRARTTASRGSQHLDKVINIDQSPIGRTPRSNPATYTGVFTFIRTLFARTRGRPGARLRAGPVLVQRQGRTVRGVPRATGSIKIEMHFLPDVYVTCEVCKGKRYNRETLEIRYKGKNIAEVLEMTVRRRSRSSEPDPAVRQKLQTLHDVGPRLHPARAGGDDALRRRGAAREALHRALAGAPPAGRSTSSTSRPRASTSPTSSGCSTC